MGISFELERVHEAARAGVLSTAHGPVETPVFMPVGTQATVKAVPQHLIEELGAQIILCNTYHLYLRPGAAQVRALGGLHRFMSWPRAILTDSGGFQVFSLSELRKVTEDGVTFRSHLDGSTHVFTPESATEAQIALGADIIMAFDECTEYPAERSRAQQSMELTVRWAKRSKAAASRELPAASENQDPSTEARKEGTPPLGRTNDGGRRPMTDDRRPQAMFGIVQGGMYADLRAECAERLAELDFPGYAIGGLSVGEPRAERVEIIARTLEHLPKDKPRYVMGVGYPDEIVEYALMGVDMMDCVLPTRAARHGLLFTSEGRMNIKNARYAQDENPADPKCGCWVCARYTRAYLRHLFVTGETLAFTLNTVHNLAHYLDTMRSVRHAIKLGKVSGLLPVVRAQQEH